jgi:two-component system LytT family response regulator
MNTLRVVIADDERPARNKLRRYMASEPGVEIIGEAACGREAVEMVGRTVPDLLFLDIQMPDLDGFAVLDALGTDAIPQVVFVTAHDHYALRAFEVHAFDYLLKPVSPERFRKVLERARQHVVRESDMGERVRRLLDQVQPGPRYAERILVPSGDRSFFLAVERIDRIEAARNYVTLFVDGETHVLRGTVEGLYRRLDPAKFLRANRSEIVRIDSVAEVQPWFHGEYRLVLKDGTQVMWTRRFVDRASEALLRQI